MIPRHAILARLPLLACALAAVTGSGCGYHYSFLRQEPVGNTSLADPRDAAMRAEIGPGSGYYLADTPAPRADGRGPGTWYGIIDVGHRLPLVTWSRGKLNDEQPELPYSDTTTSLQLSTPVVFHLLWDPLTGRRSSPIVDTDYEFGVWLSGRRGLSLPDTSRPRFEARAGLYIGHISTHVGDEYVTRAQRDPALPFPRVNVSREPWKVNVGLRRTAPPRQPGRHFYDYLQVMAQVEGASFRRFRGAEVYYQTDPSELDGLTAADIAPTGYGFDLMLAADYRRYLGRGRTITEHGDRARPESINLAVAVGRIRAFAFDPVSRTGRPRDVATLNVLAGWTPDESMVRSLAAEPYLRYYRGPNPYGQLRNDTDFWLVTFGIRWSY